MHYDLVQEVITYQLNMVGDNDQGHHNTNKKYKTKSKNGKLMKE